MVGVIIGFSSCLIWCVGGYYVTCFCENQQNKKSARFKEIIALRGKILGARSRVSMGWGLYDIMNILSKHDPSTEEMEIKKGPVCLETFIENEDILRMYYLILENECPCEKNIREIRNLQTSYERSIIVG